MTNKLADLEKQLAPYAEHTRLNEASLLLYPSAIRQIHFFKLFGDNLLAVPANLLIENDDYEFEIPFRFLESVEELRIFQSEYSNLIPAHFIQFGYLYGTDKVVLLNKLSNAVHVFHVADVADEKWLNYKLAHEVCTFDTFINQLQPQTVSCFINPSNYAEYELFEIRNATEVRTSSDIFKLADAPAAQATYMQLIKQIIEKGFELHYAPQQVIAVVGRGQS